MKAVRAGGKLLPLCQVQLKKLQKHVVLMFFFTSCTAFLSHRMGGSSLRQQRSERQQGKKLTYVWHCASVMRLPNRGAMPL